MGPEKLDNGVYYIRALLRPGRHGQSSSTTTPRPSGQTTSPTSCSSSSTARGGTPQAQQYADSLLDPGNTQNYQKHWIGVVPMEASSRAATTWRRASLRRPHATTALAGRQTPCFSGLRPGNLGLFHTGVRRRRGRQGRLRDLLADDVDHGRRRGQLRSPRPRPAAALHRRQRRDDVLRAGDRQHARRAAGSDAGDLPVDAARATPSTGHPAEHRPLLDMPLDVHAGLGQLRHRVVGGPPAARRSPVPGRRRAAGRPAGAAGPAERGGFEHPAWRRLGSTCSRHARAICTRPSFSFTACMLKSVQIGHTLPAGSAAARHPPRRQPRPSRHGHADQPRRRGDGAGSRRAARTR